MDVPIAFVGAIHPAMPATQIHSTVDFARSGKQQGHLCVPYSYNLGMAQGDCVACIAHDVDPAVLA